MNLTTKHGVHTYMILQKITFVEYMAAANATSCEDILVKNAFFKKVWESQKKLC